MTRFFRTDPEQRRKVYHVLPKGEGWSVRAEGAVRASGRFASLSEAVDAGRRLVRGLDGGQLMIHSPDGHVSTEGNG